MAESTTSWSHGPTVGVRRCFIQPTCFTHCLKKGTPIYDLYQVSECYIDGKCLSGPTGDDSGASKG